MRAAYVTLYDAQNVRAWSGLGLNIAHSLERQGIEFDYIGSLRWNGRFRYKPKEIWYRHVLKKRYLREREPGLARNFAAQVRAKLERLDCEFVFSPGCIPVAMLECKQPIITWADATFGGLVDFYPEVTNAPASSIRNGHLLERLALERARCAVFASEWAARSAVELYGADRGKVHVVPFGANLPAPEYEEVLRCIDSRPSDECRLLFLGVEWLRKGGDLAVAVAHELNRAGVKTKLTVVGCDVPPPVPEFVEPLGFISKAEPRGMERLQSVLARSHFLVLPAMAECFGVVFCEAASWGVPSLATPVGGIPSAVRANGRLFERGRFVEECVAFLLSVFRDAGQYRQLAMCARAEYDARLNWDASGRKVAELAIRACRP